MEIMDHAQTHWGAIGAGELLIYTFFKVFIVICIINAILLEQWDFI